MKCLHIIYDSYGPPIPYLIWNRYHVVPPHVHMVPPHVLYDSYGLPYLIWNRHLMVPLTLYATGIVCPPHVHMVSQHVKCLHVSYDSYGPPIPYNE